MTIALRICSVAYLVAVTTALITLSLVQQAWPAPAVDYYQWFSSQPRNSVLAPLPYLGLALLVVTWLSALALLCGKNWARWPFATAVGVILFLNIATVVSGQPPQLMSPLDSTLSEATSVLAGLLIGLSFCAPRSPPRAAP